MISDLIARAAAEDWDAVDELEQTAKRDPAALRPYLDDLLNRGLLWPPTLFLGADDTFIQRLVHIIDAGGAEAAGEGEQGPARLNQLLLILSVTRSPIAVAAFRRWQEEPPTGLAELPVDALDYARRGGWELRPDGTARDLCAPVAYQLCMVPTAPAGGGPVCPWCESPLWTVLDFDTSDPDVARALAHTGWSGRLRITTCFLCSNYTTLFTDVTTDGGATWSSHNERPEYLRTSTEEPPTVLPEIGETRATPYLASAWEEGGSTLGGFPDWIQDPAYPQCPACAETMDYVGLVGGADLDWGEGADYLFLHSACGIAAVTYQQS